MKHLLSDRIICTDENWFDNRYCLDVISAPEDGERIVDIAKFLTLEENTAVDPATDPKLWNDRYPGEHEFALFLAIVTEVLENGDRVHIENISLREEIEFLDDLYRNLGYYDASENCFRVDLAEAPVTVGVNIRNLIYSTKDYKSEREGIFFIPPPREPTHPKALLAAINSGIVATISLNDEPNETELLRMLVLEEKMSLIRLAKVLGGNREKMGMVGERKEVILDLT